MMLKILYNTDRVNVHNMDPDSLEATERGLTFTTADGKQWIYYHHSIVSMVMWEEENETES